MVNINPIKGSPDFDFTGIQLQPHVSVPQGGASVTRDSFFPATHAQDNAVSYQLWWPHVLELLFLFLWLRTRETEIAMYFSQHLEMNPKS